MTKTQSLYEFCKLCTSCRGDGCHDCGGIGEVEVFATAETVLNSGHELSWIPVGSSNEVSRYFADLFLLGVKFGKPQAALNVVHHFAWTSGVADNVDDVESVNSMFIQGVAS
jgi:hypothetical protein